MRISDWSSDVCSSDLLMIMGFVFFHAFGNLKVYFGAESFNHYGEFLRELLVPLLPRTWGLWLLRTGIIVAFVLHIHSAYSLTRMNRRAIGRASCRARVCQYVSISVVAVTSKKN